MKVCFTESDVEKIILEYVQRKFAVELNTVVINTYRSDFCVVTYEEPVQGEKEQA